MKPENIQKLSEVYRNLTDAKFIGEAEMIMEIIRSEASAVRQKKFNMYDYCVGKKDWRDALKGVYHQDGWKVATEMHILVAVKEEYDKSYEGKILMPDGTFCKDECKQAKWRKIIPMEKGYLPYKVDRSVYNDWLEKKRAEFAAQYGKKQKFEYDWHVIVGNAYLRAELFDKMLVAMDYIGAEEILVMDYKHPVYAKQDKGVVVLMPSVEPKCYAEDVLQL